jgi:hypothetical protein
MRGESLPLEEEMWYTIVRDEKGPVTRSSPGPWPRGSDTLANISILHWPAGVSLPAGFVLSEKSEGTE